MNEVTTGLFKHFADAAGFRRAGGFRAGPGDACCGAGRPGSSRYGLYGSGVSDGQPSAPMVGAGIGGAFGTVGMVDRAHRARRSARPSR